MSHRHVYLLEKFQVQLATLVAMTAVYALAWPVVRPEDPQGPISFLPSGNLAGLACLAGIVLFLAAAGAVLTAFSRPVGALVATLIGAAGVSLRSPSIRGLLWQHDRQLPAVYAQLMAEMLVLAGVLALAAAVAHGLRRLIGAVRPNWLWPDPAAKSGFQHERPPRPSAAGQAKGRSGAKDIAPRPVVLQALLCFGAGLACTVIPLLALLQSGDRGQVLFALFASGLVGVLIAQQFVPSRYSVTAWGVPVVAALALYALAAATVGASDQAWMHVPYYGHVLPVDWLTAGAGGAVAGFWIAARLREVRHLEEKDQQSQA